MKKILLLAGVWAFLGGCVRMTAYSPTLSESAMPNEKPAIAQPGPQTHRIRVAIVVRQASVHLMAPETFVFSGFPIEGTPIIAKGQERYHEATLTSDKLYAHKAYIEPLGEGDIQVDGRSYKGSIEILEDQKGTLTVINELSLENYVMGVLAGEIPRNWPLEALKAQAIAARTFAVLTQTQARQKGGAYDIENTALFQMYRGSELVNENIQKAVGQTQDDILTYRSAPILAFYHSNCGGKTSRALGVWSKDQPYLKSTDCPFGNNGAHFRWRTEMPLADLIRKLRKAGFKAADVVRLEPLGRDESGRITELAVMDENGHRTKMKASAFRMAVGPDLIRSTRFDALVQSNKVVFSGKGWGHGVGLCQEGAYGMAMKGYNAFDILRHYYRGIMIEKLGNNENKLF
jgi:stage II sporulation protein D